MDREEIRYLLGSTIYARAKAYEIASGDWSSDVCSSDLPPGTRTLGPLIKSQLLYQLS